MVLPPVRVRVGFHDLWGWRTCRTQRGLSVPFVLSLVHCVNRFKSKTGICLPRIVCQLDLTVINVSYTAAHGGNMFRNETYGIAVVGEDVFFGQMFAISCITSVSKSCNRRQTQLLSSRACPLTLPTLNCNLCKVESTNLEDLPDFNLFYFSLTDFTSGEEVETVTEKCSYLKIAGFSRRHGHFWTRRAYLVAFWFLNWIFKLCKLVAWLSKQQCYDVN